MAKEGSMAWFEAVSRSDDVKTLQYLLDKGATSINCQDHMDGRTALILASFWGHLNCVKLLVERKADLGLTDRVGRSALDAAVRHPEVLQVLLDAGANINQVDEDGWTAIMRATSMTWSRPCRESMALLLERGADLSFKTRLRSLAFDAGSTVMDIANAKSLSQDRLPILQLFDSAKDLFWSPVTHGHFPIAFKCRVKALLVLHRTMAVQSKSGGYHQELHVTHCDPNNRFWKLPKPLFFRVLEFSAPLRRLIQKERFLFVTC